MILPSKVGNSLFHAASLFLTLSITSRQNSFSVGLFPLGGPSVSLAAFALHSLVNKAFEQTCSSNPTPSRPLLLRLTFRSEPSRRIEVPALGYDSIRISSEKKDSSISILKMRHLNLVGSISACGTFLTPSLRTLQTQHEGRKVLCMHRLLI